VNLSSSLVPIFPDSKLKTVHSGFFVSTEITPGKFELELVRCLRGHRRSVSDTKARRGRSSLRSAVYKYSTTSDWNKIWLARSELFPSVHHSNFPLLQSFITPPFPICRRRLPNLSFAIGPTGYLRCRGSETRRRYASTGAERSLARCLAPPL
jgi:hypothetical protein